MTDLRLGCAVVTHNSADAIGGLLETLPRLAPDAVAVVDHESADDTLDVVGAWEPPCALDVLRRPNRGYAAGVNAAVAALRSRGVDIIALLNPDARIAGAGPEAVRELFASRRRLGSACPLTLSGDGRRIDTLGLRLTTWGVAADHDQGRPAGWTGTRAIRGVIGPCGGSALYRSEALAALDGPFDARFFLYFEDADVALRLRAAGWETVTTDVLVVRHERSGLGGLATALTSDAARLAAVERQRSYERFVATAPLPVARRLVGRPAARLRRQLVHRRLSEEDRHLR